MSLVANIGTAVRLLIEAKKGLVRIDQAILKDQWH